MKILSQKCCLGCGHYKDKYWFVESCKKVHFCCKRRDESARDCHLKTLWHRLLLLGLRAHKFMLHNFKNPVSSICVYTTDILSVTALPVCSLLNEFTFQALSRPIFHLRNPPPSICNSSTRLICTGKVIPKTHKKHMAAQPDRSSWDFLVRTTQTSTDCFNGDLLCCWRKWKMEKSTFGITDQGTVKQGVCCCLRNWQLCECICSLMKTYSSPALANIQLLLNGSWHPHQLLLQLLLLLPLCFLHLFHLLTLSTLL